MVPVSGLGMTARTKADAQEVARRAMNEKARAAEEAALAALMPPVREPGVGDPPAPVAKPLRLVLDLRDGNVNEIVLDVESAPYLMIEWQAPMRGQPWIREAEHARIGLFSVKSIRLEEIDDDPEAA
jgi:hypothetical protein